MSTPIIPIKAQQAYLYAAFLVLYEFLTYISNDMIMPGMIHVVETFHANITAVANSLTAYVLGGSSLQIFLGPLSDRFGRRPVMLIGVALFFAFTLLIAGSTSMEQFIFARFFQGMGLCFIGVIGYATLQEIFAEKDAVRLIAIISVVAILAPLLGPLAGALFINFFGWRIIFLTIAALSLVAFWGLWLYMPEPLGQTKSDGEKIEVQPLAPKHIANNYLKLLKNRQFICGAVAGGVLNIPCLCWIALSPIILMKNAGLTVVEYALWQIPVFGATMLGIWTLHAMTKRFSIQHCFAIGSFLSVSSLLFASLLPKLLDADFLWFMPGLVVYFFALGITSATNQRLILFSTEVAKGTASALMTFIFMCILAGGIELSNILFALFGNPGFTYYCSATAILYLLISRLAF